MKSDQLLFPPFRLDIANECLWRGAEQVPLRRKTFAVLQYLAEHANRVVTKEELLAALWPGIYVSEKGPRVCIREIRVALGDDLAAPQFIETVQGRGYRFLPAVTTQPVLSSKFQVPGLRAGDESPSLGAWNVKLETHVVAVRRNSGNCKGG